MKPLILLSNDDGVSAKGLNFLIDALRPIADLFVMAPNGPRSGAGCGLTSTVPISYQVVRAEDGLTVCSCTGTPVDCIKLALDQVLMRRPDLVAGGINHGNNASVNAHYSGTMGIAFEAAIQGIPSIAFSLCNHDPKADFTPLRPYLPQMVRMILEKGIPYHTCLNVNFPNTERFEGVKICRMAVSRWQEEYTPCDHPHGGHYYWLSGDCINEEPAETDTDLWALEHNYIAITPTRVDVTAYELADEMKNWSL